jgi:predicted RNA binding protein YcfA (HicA-like mRNA interferase family)
MKSDSSQPTSNTVPKFESKILRGHVKALNDILKNEEVTDLTSLSDNDGLPHILQQQYWSSSDRFLALIDQTEVIAHAVAKERAQKIAHAASESDPGKAAAEILTAIRSIEDDAHYYVTRHGSLPDSNLMNARGYLIRLFAHSCVQSLSFQMFSNFPENKAVSKAVIKIIEVIGELGVSAVHPGFTSVMGLAFNEQAAETKKVASFLDTLPMQRSNAASELVSDITQLSAHYALKETTMQVCEDPPLFLKISPVTFAQDSKYAVSQDFIDSVYACCASVGSTEEEANAGLSVLTLRTNGTITMFNTALSLPYFFAGEKSTEQVENLTHIVMRACTNALLNSPEKERPQPSVELTPAQQATEGESQNMAVPQGEASVTTEQQGNKPYVRIPSMPCQTAHDKLLRLKLTVKRQRGSHVIYEGLNGATYPIPMHKGEDVSQRILLKGLDIWGIDPQDFIDA